MVRLALALRDRGLEVELACPEPPPGADRSLAEEARAVGLAPALEIERGRGSRWLRDGPDAARLAAHLAARDVDLVHCWHTRDHLMGLRAAWGRRRSGRTALVRSYRSAGRIPRTPWNRWLLGPGSDGLLCVSPATARANAPLRGGRPVAGHFGAVDLERFRPAAPDPGVRRALGLGSGSRVVGIVARVQRHRRFDLLLDAARRLFARVPEARLLIVGRGTHRAEVAEAPARELGIADRVIFAGYRVGDYAEILRAMDLFTFLVPGSDGTCRALLEAAACGIPAVTSRQGALSEIVVDGETGLLVDERPEALARAWEELLNDPSRRQALGAAARSRAEVLFAPDGLADAVVAFYSQVRERSS